MCDGSAPAGAARAGSEAEHELFTARGPRERVTRSLIVASPGFARASLLRSAIVARHCGSKKRRCCYQRSTADSGITVGTTVQSQDRLAEWFREWRTSLRRFLLARPGASAADIDDIAQEVFLRLLRYDRMDLVQHPQAYPFKIAANVSSEWATRASRAQPHSADWLEDLIDPATPLGAAERESSEALIRGALASLPPRTREILRLLHEEGLGYEQISEHLGLTRRIVKRVVVESYAALRRAIPSGAARSSGNRTP